MSARLGIGLTGDARVPNTARRAPPTPGELWTQGALRDLRGAGYRPEAWLRFLAASRTRARETAAARPRLRRQARRWESALVAGAFATPHLLRRQGLPAPSTATLGGWALAEAAMLDWHLGMVETPAGERRPLRSADALTLGRAWLAPLAGAAPSRRGFGLAVLALAAASDAADGALARRGGAVTRLGEALDPAADMACLGALALGAAREGLLARWAFGALIARHAVTTALRCGHYFAHAEPPPGGSASATRWTAPATVAGLGLALAGRRRAGSALVTVGALAALGLTLAGR